MLKKLKPLAIGIQNPGAAAQQQHT